jgi:ubiquinol-cytochrome c reductase subunit 7
MVLLGGPLGISLAPYILKNPGLHKFVKPLANAFINASGYRKVGLRYDDLREYQQSLTMRRGLFQHILSR